MTFLVQNSSSFHQCIHRKIAVDVKCHASLHGSHLHSPWDIHGQRKLDADFRFATRPAFLNLFRQLNLGAMKGYNKLFRFSTILVKRRVFSGGNFLRLKMKGGVTTFLVQNGHFGIRIFGLQRYGVVRSMGRCFVIVHEALDGEFGVFGQYQGDIKPCHE